MSFTLESPIEEVLAKGTAERPIKEWRQDFVSAIIWLSQKQNLGGKDNAPFPDDHPAKLAAIKSLDPNATQAELGEAMGKLIKLIKELQE